MTPREFVKTFLPNFDERLENELRGLQLEYTIRMVENAFILNYFEEALENFTNKICEKQKEICTNDLDVFFRIQSIITYESIKEVVSSSTTPKIEDL